MARKIAKNVDNLSSEKYLNEYVNSKEFIEYYDDPNPRENILKLGTKITDRVGQKLGITPVTSKDPEYWALAALLDDEMCDLALQFDVRKPMTLPQIVEKTGRSAEELQPILDKLAWSGVFEYNWENDAHEKQYVLPMYVPGSAEFSNMNFDIIDEHPEMGIFFEHMTRLPLEKITKATPMGGSGIGMHVIPVEKAISQENQSVSLEHISHWLDKYDGVYAISPCSCRKSRSKYSEGCGDDYMWCLAMGDMAHYVVETNKGGKYVDRAEAERILAKAEKMGYVHQITNIDGENKIFAICNCNVNVCYALRTSFLFNTPNLSRSAYVAKVEKENCVACGQCVEKCPGGAVKLGRKLCAKDGSQIANPKQSDPADYHWNESLWDWDYRDHNRIETYPAGTAPCKASCPAHIGIQGYLRLANQGRYDEALELIKKDNPFPAVCGRVCNKRCEDACTRATIDEAIAIDEVKNFLAQRDLKAETRYIPEKQIPQYQNNCFEEKIAIIGGGPAGLSCAYYLALHGYKPTVFEKNEKAGGMLTYGIPAFKLPKDVVDAEVDVLKALDVDVKTGVEVGKDVTIDELREQGYKAFYIAIGCQGARKPNIPGEDAENVMLAVDFLHEVYANPEFKVNGKTVVIGGGNVAIDVARDAMRKGAESVRMFSLEQRDEMPATDEEIFEAEEENIDINCGWGPKEVLTKDGKVCGIILKKCTQVKDADGRFNPQYDEDDTITIECENVYFSIGQAIVWGDLLNGQNVELGRGNSPVIDPKTYQTTCDDIFVGGDVQTGPKFAIDAIAAGRFGAYSIHRFVREGCTMTIARDYRDIKSLDKEDIKIGSYDETPRQKARIDETVDRKNTFNEYKQPFTEEQVKAETDRCLKCGASEVDPLKCVGCGVCTVQCKFDAIHLHRERPDASIMRTSEDKLKYIGIYAAKREAKLIVKDIKNKIKGIEDKPYVPYVTDKED